MDNKTIDVRDQVTLSFGKSFRFCRKGISYRLFRSMLTLAVVVVAVAFFTVLLSESIMVRAIGVGVSQEMSSAREADVLLMHLFHRYSNVELSAKLAGMYGADDRIREFSRVAGISESKAKDIVAQCRVEQLYLNFFKNISPGKRVVLLRKNTGRDAFDYLADKVAWQEFKAALQDMRSVRLPEGVDTLRSFLDNREAFIRDLNAARQGRDRTVSDMEQKLSDLTGDRSHSDWIAAASDAEVEQWRKIVEKSGFRVSAAKMARVQKIMQLSSLERRIARLLQSPEKKQEWRKIMQDTAGLEKKFTMLKDDKVAEILEGRFSMEERAAVSDRFVRMARLREVMGILPAVDMSAVSKQSFLEGRQVFLVVISFLVCVVGVTNAMLMSITERFREIATMKCLGATDGFILKQFLIEAAVQGVVGGTAGMIIGMLISTLKSSLIFGGMVFVYFPAVQLLYCAIITVVIGILLAMLASVYPSRAAARMSPMDAMRVE